MYFLIVFYFLLMLLLLLLLSLADAMFEKALLKCTLEYQKGQEVPRHFPDALQGGTLVAPCEML